MGFSQHLKKGEISIIRDIAFNERLLIFIILLKCSFTDYSHSLCKIGDIIVSIINCVHSEGFSQHQIKRENNKTNIHKMEKASDFTHLYLIL